MLTLTRRQGERIIIEVGEHKVIVEVQQTRAGAVRLGIDASREVEVWREEIYESLQHEEKRDG